MLRWVSLLVSVCAACSGGPLEFVVMSDMVVLLHTFILGSEDIIMNIARPWRTEVDCYRYLITSQQSFTGTVSHLPCSLLVTLSKVITFFIAFLQLSVLAVYLLFAQQGQSMQCQAIPARPFRPIRLEASLSQRNTKLTK